MSDQFQNIETLNNIYNNLLKTVINNTDYRLQQMENQYKLYQRCMCSKIKEYCKICTQTSNKKIELLTLETERLQKIIDRSVSVSDSNSVSVSVNKDEFSKTISVGELNRLQNELTNERDNLIKERNDLTNRCDILTKDRDNLTKERDALQHRLTQALDALSISKIAISNLKETNQLIEAQIDTQNNYNNYNDDQAKYLVSENLMLKEKIDRAIELNNTLSYREKYYETQLKQLQNKYNQLINYVKK